MTAQTGDTLKYKDKEYLIATEPLNQYLAKLKKNERPVFQFERTDCWRGYFAKWEVKEDKLYLTGFKTLVGDHKEVGIRFIFAEQSEVFAKWYTGEIRVPQGELLHYHHSGYASIFERDLFLEIKEGMLVNTRVIDNRR